ncbi:MAG: GspH/FimT family pseudopilin [Deltaproteobacteria bacterium]|nr:GspH/FimT family pseudopilin [Deltaproteobacteria bacterium]
MKAYLNNESGFTMIELILVIAILGVLSSIAALSGKDMYDNYKTRGAARQLYSDMQYARLSAIKGGRPWVVDFMDDKSYRVMIKDSTVYKTINIPLQFKGVKICNYTDSLSPLKDAQFNPNGTAGGTAADFGVKVSLGGKVYKIYIPSIGTGIVRVINLSSKEPLNAIPCP